MAKIRTIEEIELLNASQPNFGKGIMVASGFDLGARSPLDSRATAKTIEERNAHVTSNRAYEGMLVYVEEDKKTYQLIDGQWVEFGFNDENFQAGIVDSLTSSDKNKALSANQGRVLKGLIDGHVADGDKHITAEERAKIAASASTSDLNSTKSELKAAIDAEVSRAQGEETKIRGEVALKANQSDLVALQGKVTAAEGSLGTLRTDLTSEINRAKAEEAAIRSEVADVQSELEEQIESVRGIVTGKTSTYVVETYEELLAIPEPKIGDLVLVINERKSYIYSNIDLARASEGKWIVFDEITNEVQLDKYATKELVEATYRKKSDKIAKADLDAAVSAKIDQIDSKANAADVYTKVQSDATKAELVGKIDGVDGKVTAVNADLTSVKGRVGTLEGTVGGHGTRLTKVESDLAKVPTQISSAVSELEEALVADIEEVEAKADANKGLIDALTPRVTAVEGKASANESAIAQVKVDLAATDRQVETNKNDIAGLKAKVAVVEYVEEFAGNEQVTLARKPVGAVKFFVNGVKYKVTLQDKTVITSGLGFGLDASDAIEVIYQA